MLMMKRRFLLLMCLLPTRILAFLLVGSLAVGYGIIVAALPDHLESLTFGQTITGTIPVSWIDQSEIYVS